MSIKATRFREARNRPPPDEPRNEAQSGTAAMATISITRSGYASAATPNTSDGGGTSVAPRRLDRGDV